MKAKRKATLSLGIIVPLGSGFLIAVALAYQSYDASRKHRSTVRQTVQSHADFAAYLLSDIVDQRLSLAMLYAFYEEDRAHNVDGAQPSAPDVLVQEQELLRCEADLSRDQRFFFRYSFDDHQLVSVGEIPRVTRAALLAALASATPESGNRSFTHLIRPSAGDGPSVIAYRFRSFGDTGGAFAYGLNSCFRDHEGDVFEIAKQTTGVFPPALVGDSPPDSLYSLALLGSDGTLLRGATADSSVGPVGTAPLSPTDAYDGMELRVKLRPATVAALAGDYPASRLPLAIALVVLSGGLMLLAIAQLRREHEVIRVRERFVGNVSHELRTPLQQILLLYGPVAIEQDEDKRRTGSRRAHHRSGNPPLDWSG